MADSWMGPRRSDYTDCRRWRSRENVALGRCCGGYQFGAVLYLGFHGLQEETGHGFVLYHRRQRKKEVAPEVKGSGSGP